MTAVWVTIGALALATAALKLAGPLALGGRPRPVTPYYLMLSTTVQPEFSAAVVGVKTPEQALDYAKRRLEYMLSGLR